MLYRYEHLKQCITKLSNDDISLLVQIIANNITINALLVTLSDFHSVKKRLQDT